MKNLFSILVVAFAALSLQVAVISPTYADEQVKKTKKNPDKRVCRYVRETGSRIREKVCRKQKDWDRIENASQESVERSAMGAKRARSAGES